MRISDWSADVCSSDLVQRQSRVHVGNVGVGNQAGDAQIDLAAAGAERRVVELAALDRLDCARQQLGVHREADFLDLPGLVLTEQFAGTADFEIVRRQRKARAEIAQRFDRVEALLRRSEEHTSELQSLMRIPYAVFCLQKKK